MFIISSGKPSKRSGHYPETMNVHHFIREASKRSGHYPETMNVHQFIRKIQQEIWSLS